MKIVTAAEMREIDRLTTEQYGVPSLTLMENAGTAVAEFAQKHFDFTSVCVVCGKGNNGGDGFVAARKLKDAGKKVAVVILAGSAKELRDDAARMFKKLPIKPVWVGVDAGLAKPAVRQALRADLIIDAILGTGFKPPLKGIAEKAIALINNSRAWVLAIDVPSGIDTDRADVVEPNETFVRADAVVSFTAPKPALVFAGLSDGPIAIAQIGSPPQLVGEKSSLKEDVITSADVQRISIPRPPDAHKGDFGHVLVIGGSVGKSGAAAMAGLAALRAGAGLVTVACPKSVQPLVAAFAPELMTEPLDETVEGTIAVLALAKREELLQGKSVVVLGPGLSRNRETAEFIHDFTGICSVSMVIDADALNAFAGRAQELLPDKEADDFALRVLTPHPGEMARLAGKSTAEVQLNRVRIALDMAAQTQACVVLKGHRTVIASPGGHVWINTTGNPGMAKGGSGDVLSGIVGGLLAQAPYLQEMYGWRADADPETWPSTSPYLKEIYRWISRKDPRLHEIQELGKHLSKTDDPAPRDKIWAKMQAGIWDTVTLIGTLHVCRAVYLHGLAGDVARDKRGESAMIATDMIDCLGDAVAICENESHSKFAYLQR